MRIGSNCCRSDLSKQINDGQCIIKLHSQRECISVKKPIKPAVSLRGRFATGVPITISPCPLKRASTAAHAANRVMNKVTPWRWLSFFKLPVKDAGNDTVRYRPGVALYCRARPVGRHGKQRRCAFQVTTPEIYPVLQYGTAEPVALPVRIVDILYRQGGEWIGLTLSEGAIQGRYLTDQHTDSTNRPK